MWSHQLPDLSSRRLHRGMLYVMSALLLSSCGGSSGDTVTEVTPPPPPAPPPVVPPAVASVAVLPTTVSLEIGQSAPVTATVRDANGNVLTDRTVNWSSATPAVATVGASGASVSVTAVAPGSAVITASVGTVTASVTVTVVSTPAALEVVAGNAQRGLLNRPLADSLVVRVRSSGGAPLANTPVTWSATGGTLSQSTVTTNAQGEARVQFTPSAASSSVSAAVAGLAPSTFNVIARGGGACTLTPSTATQRFSLGPTDFTLSLRSTAPLRIAVVYVDYPGLAATETPAALMSSVVEPGLAQLRTMSYNRLNISAVTFPTWYRMPKVISEYDWTTFASHRAFLLDVLSVTDSAIDYSGFDAIFVFSPPSSNKPISPTFNGGSTANVVADGRNFGNAVTYGNDVRSFGPSITAHETLHMLGLVDLYAFTSAGGEFYAGNQFKYVGAWSLMSNVFVPGHILTWEKRKLGWIDEAQVDCLDAAGGVETVLTPNSAVGGQKMVVVPMDASSALVVEVRDNLGLGANLDNNLCAAGVLLYEVDARTPTGQGPARLIGSRASTTGPLFTRCGPWADGPFGFGTSPVLNYTHTPTGTQVSVLRAEANGAVRVRVKR